MQTCKIQWIDRHGNPTPDNNPAIGRVRTKARDQRIGGRLIHFRASDWFPICAEHAAQLKQPGMEIWEFANDANDAGAVSKLDVRPLPAKAAGLTNRRGSVLANPKTAAVKTVNPHKHAYPHAKLYNITLTPISRLTKGVEKLSGSLIQNSDVRNYSISRAAEYKAKFGGKS
jgi:hypothetical protein